jgi:arsenate reductase (thioredoxin)
MPKKKGLTVQDSRQRTTPPSPKKKILFLCACNSIRSQMAEGLLRASYGDRYEVSSAGLKPDQVAPLAIRVMAELGIDISAGTSKSLETLVGTKFDCVAFVCGDPKGPCPFAPRDQHEFACKGCSTCCTFHPFFPAGRRTLHAQFPNLIEYGDAEDRIDLFRRVRDDIRAWVELTFGGGADL